MSIKTLGSSQKIRVGRESGNTTFIFLGLSEDLNLLYSHAFIHFYCQDNKILIKILYIINHNKD